MRVLMITGDKNFGPGHPRYELQKSAVEELAVFTSPRKDSLARIFNAAWRGHYDVITAQDPFFRGHLAQHLVQLFGGKLNIQVHTDLSAASRWRRIFSLLQLRRADSIRVVSEKIKTQVEQLGVHAPITVLPVFVDLERFKNISRVEHDQKTILWIGRFEEEKNPMAAIDIFKKVRDAGVDAKLIMLGKGSLEVQLRQQVQHLLSQDEPFQEVLHLLPERAVEFPGWQDPVPFLAQADVVLCTSLHESWGASIVEALAAGVPVVAPDVGVAREAGAVVVDRSKLAEAVIGLLNSGERGELKLKLPTQHEWAGAWRESLLPSKVEA